MAAYKIVKHYGLYKYNHGKGQIPAEVEICRNNDLILFSLMTTEQIIADITSRDTNLVWSSSCYIITLSQDRAAIQPLIKHLEAIKQQTKGLDMGGLFAPNQRFVDLAIKIIAFHKNGTGCTCQLYPGHDRFDPLEEGNKGNIAILETVKIQDKWIDHYTAQCLRCGQQFRITEGESHYTWWDWKVM